MRRAAALLILLAGGWSQLLGAHCATGLPQSQPHQPAAGDVTAAVHGPGDHHGRGHGSSARAAATSATDAATDAATAALAPATVDPPAAPSHHTDAGCRLLLPCVSGLLPATNVGPTAPSPAIGDDVLPRSLAASDIDRLPLDPPPPRLPV